jgi:hypothetical protein
MMQIKTRIKNYVMKFTSCLFILITLLGRAYTQDNVFRQMSDNTFMYDGRIGKLHTFKDVILLDSANLYSDFQKFDTERKCQESINTIYGAVGGLFVSLGIVFYISDLDAAIGVGTLYTGIGISTTAIGLLYSKVAHGNSKNRYKQSLLGKLLYRHKEIGNLQLEVINSGVGLVYRF